MPQGHAAAATGQWREVTEGGKSVTADLDRVQTVVALEDVTA
jgi:hypothetical protein